MFIQTVNYPDRVNWNIPAVNKNIICHLPDIILQNLFLVVNNVAGRLLTYSSKSIYINSTFQRAKSILLTITTWHGNTQGTTNTMRPPIIGSLYHITFLPRHKECIIVFNAGLDICPNIVSDTGLTLIYFRTALNVYKPQTSSQHVALQLTVCAVWVHDCTSEPKRGWAAAIALFTDPSTCHLDG